MDITLPGECDFEPRAATPGRTSDAARVGQQAIAPGPGGHRTPRRGPIQHRPLPTDCRFDK